MFWTRLASGIVLLIIAIGSMSYGKAPLAAILCVVSLAAFRELTKALKCADGKGEKPGAHMPNGLEWAGILGIAAYYGVLYVAGDDTFLLMCIVGTFLAVMFVYVLAFPKYNANQAMAAVFSFLYAPVLLSFVYQTRMAPQGIYTVWMILISSWGCDTCAYCVGMLLGKHKLVPVLSPKKTIEGAVGGVAGAALLGYLFACVYGSRMLEVGNPRVACGIACAIAAVISQVGDLAASAIKRNHDIKDYGHLIPGHGGILDRFDSMLFTAPAIYFAVTFLR